MSNWIHKGFTFQTNKAAYRCNYNGLGLEPERWEITIRHAGGDVTGTYHLPATWARTMVFQFLNDLDQGKQDVVEYQEEQLTKLRRQLREAEDKLLALGHTIDHGTLTHED